MSTFYYGVRYVVTKIQHWSWALFGLNFGLQIIMIIMIKPLRPSGTSLIVNAAVVDSIYTLKQAILALGKQTYLTLNNWGVQGECLITRFLLPMLVNEELNNYCYWVPPLFTQYLQNSVESGQRKCYNENGMS